MAILLLLALLAAGCAEGPATPAGYWEGKGTAMEMPMNDLRKLRRSAEFEFWFVLDEGGDAVGEIELTYDAELRVNGLPNVTVPAPGAGTVKFEPHVGGKLTDLDPSRQYPLIGAFDGQRLILEIAKPEEERKPLEFTIRADAGVSGGLPSGAGIDVGDVQIIVHKIDMKPFSPFHGPAAVEKRPGGPYAARYEDRGEGYSVEWSARQMGGERRAVEMTPELELELRRLREQLGTL